MAGASGRLRSLYPQRRLLAPAASSHCNAQVSGRAEQRLPARRTELKNWKDSCHGLLIYIYAIVLDTRRIGIVVAEAAIDP